MIGKKWIIPAGILAAALAYAQTDTLVVNDTANYKGAAKSITWRDRGGQSRTIFINQAKGHISYYQYDINCPDIWNNSMSGINAVISHYSNDYFSSRSIAADSTFTDVLRGPYHAIHRVSFFWPHYVRAANAFLPKKIRITFDYLVITGQDYFLIAYTWDTGRLPALDGRDEGYDTRAPYCDVDWNARYPRDVARKFAKWRCGTDGTFTLYNPATGAWRKTFHDNLVTFNTVWDDSVDREIGIVATESYWDKPMGYEWQDGNGGQRACTDTGDTAWPQAVPFQNSFFESGSGDKITWGSAWCVGRNDEACSTTVIRGYPYYNYSVMMLLGRHSENKTGNLTGEQVRYCNSALANVRGGRVRIAGPGGPGDTTRVVWKKPGYNPVYRTWEMEAESSAILFTFAGDTLVNPTFVVHNYNTDSVPALVTVSSIRSGVPLANGVDYYASVDRDEGRLFITLADTCIGASDISIATAQAKVGNVRITPAGGTAINRMTVTLLSLTAGARIYYTTDGTAPDSFSQLYTGPFPLTDSGTVQAVGYQAGLLPSTIASAVFAVFTDTTAPVIDSIRTRGDTNRVVVYFSEGVAKTGAEDPAHYALDQGATIVTARQDYYFADRVTFSLSHAVPNTNYQLTVQGISDLAGNLVAAGTGASFLFPAYPAPSVQDSLQGCWGFNEGSDSLAIDISGHGNLGAIRGAQWTAGRYGQALLFNGDTSTYVDVGTGQFNLSQTNEFTVALWVKRAGDSSGTLLSRGTDAYPFALEYSDSGFIRNTVRTYLPKYLASAGVPAKDAWCHMSLTYGNGASIFYMNGTADTSREVEGIPALGSNQRTRIGQGFSGVIDAVRIYNRALRPEEIALLYNLAADTTGIKVQPIDKDQRLWVTVRPNPFVPDQGITFALPAGVMATRIGLYDLRGRLVRDFAQPQPEDGSIHWDGRDRDGEMAVSGVYVLRIDAGMDRLVQRILLTQ